MLLSFWACRLIEVHVPCGHGGFSFYVVWAASGGAVCGVCPLRGGCCALRARGLLFYCCLGRLRRGQKGPVKGAAPPGEAPSALPPDDPAGLVVYSHSHGLALRGFPYAGIPRGLRGFCSGSFLASLGDLPARRAMPAGGIALDERAESVGLAVWSHRNEGYCLGKVRWGSHSCCFIENKAGLVL